jgi:hypothetical protein
MKLRVLIFFLIPVTQNCEVTDKDLTLVRTAQEKIDLLWTIETSDSLRATNKHYIKNFGATQNGKTVWLDNLNTDNWPEDLISYHDILYDSANMPIASQDALLDAHLGSCLSRHYFNNEGNVFARLVNNYYYDRSTGIIVNERRLEYFGAKRTSIGKDYLVQDHQGKLIESKTGPPQLDGRRFPFYPSFEEFVASNKIGQ